MFLEYFIEIYQISQKILIFASSVLTFFVNFCSDVSIYKIILAHFDLELF